ncbi:MAG TPA: YihY/virulence factor BrkB family protein [Pseudolysinimonas sp.]|nr:YihY/virulence factor BrkB family protein [Pseudolysinimonas sp.]
MAAPEKAPHPLVAWVTGRATWVQSLKPVRVALHYSRLRGPILASGLAFQGLFAVFAGLWVAFSIAGLVISDNVAAQNAIVTALNNAIPGLIDTGDGSGAIKVRTLLSAGAFGWTGAIALIGLLYSALGWLGSARDAVRTMFELPSPAANFAVLKVRDLALGVGLGIVVMVSAVLSVAGTSATGFLLGLAGITTQTVIATVLSRIVTLGVMFVLDTVVIAAFYRLLAAIRIPRRRLWAGALLGAIGLGLLKTLGSALLGAATNNPLIASFAVLAGLLLFFNLVCQVILIAASWIATGVEDAGIVVDPRVAAQRLANARELLAAHDPEPEPRPRRRR